jgi:hypothetical protein
MEVLSMKSGSCCYSNKCHRSLLAYITRYISTFFPITGRYIKQHNFVPGGFGILLLTV